jgi:hypothetical protein
VNSDLKNQYKDVLIPIKLKESKKFMGLTEFKEPKDLKELKEFMEPKEL